MGYRSDIRIITSKDGFERLKEFIKEYLKDNKEDYNLLEECDIKEEGKEQCYFGWNYVKWYEHDYPEVIAIMEGLNHLGENEYSYRYMIIGESYDDYEEMYNESNIEEEQDLEFPSYIRYFDDDYTKDKMKQNDIGEELAV